LVVTLRLKRFGRLNHPTYRLCAADSRSPRDGRIIEMLGHYLPKSKRPDEQLKLNVERVAHWLAVGAQPSETARSLIRKAGIALPPPKRRRPKTKRKSKAKAKPFVPPRKKQRAKKQAASGEKTKASES
jgi:small subunit ribosomal protein S16